ncbi:TPA: hypothetical protein N0F65_005353 [Lagenidium giganteum]|uniref:Uncharacterized protein n=1 Tax=Lagenidium giganteum TaxID=4803 RepID=A0AAV2YKH3_9STRA|nr:TPA: hypothetical protein N0F65_005353 [Lagenidium giganteum]
MCFFSRHAERQSKKCRIVGIHSAAEDTCWNFVYSERGGANSSNKVISMCRFLAFPQRRARAIHPSADGLCRQLLWTKQKQLCGQVSAASSPRGHVQGDQLALFGQGSHKNRM